MIFQKSKNISILWLKWIKNPFIKIYVRMKYFMIAKFLLTQKIEMLESKLFKTSKCFVLFT